MKKKILAICLVSLLVFGVGMTTVSAASSKNLQGASSWSTTWFSKWFSKPVKPPVTTPVKPPTTPTTPTTPTSLSVKDFGAKGDGVTDDTIAIQKAIDDASNRSVLLTFPASKTPYLITDTLFLKSNVLISGAGATLYMPSQVSPKAMLRTTGSEYFKNISIDGLSFLSNNDRVGENYEVDSLTSNVQAIYLRGVDGLSIKNVRMDNMYNGLKLNASDTNVLNLNVKVDNLQIYKSHTPIYADGTNGFSISNSILDASGGVTHWLHCVYISADTNNFVFDNVQFKNSPGGGVTVGSSYPDRADPKNIVVKNSTIENCNRGVNIYGASNITLTNLNVNRCNLGFAVHGGQAINVTGVKLANATQTASLSGSNNQGVFEIGDVSNSSFSNITVDALGMVGDLCALSDTITDVTLSNLVVTNMNDIRFFETASNLIDGFVVKDSRFEWSNITTRRINFRTAGVNATFKNNVFVNNGSFFDSLAYQEKGTNVLLEDNKYSGFKSLAYSDDYSITRNNMNSTTQVYDINKN